MQWQQCAALDDVARAHCKSPMRALQHITLTYPTPTRNPPTNLQPRARSSWCSLCCRAPWQTMQAGRRVRSGGCTVPICWAAACCDAGTSTLSPTHTCCPHAGPCPARLGRLVRAHPCPLWWPQQAHGGTGLGARPVARAASPPWHAHAHTS
jgi:hypothetical protein